MEVEVEPEGDNHLERRTSEVGEEKYGSKGRTFQTWR